VLLFDAGVIMSSSGNPIEGLWQFLNSPYGISAVTGAAYAGKKAAEHRGTAQKFITEAANNFGLGRRPSRPTMPYRRRRRRTLRSTGLKLKRRRGRSYVQRKKKRRKYSRRPFSKAQFRKILRLIKNPPEEPVRRKIIASFQFTSGENQCSYHTVSVGQRAEFLGQFDPGSGGTGFTELAPTTGTQVRDDFLEETQQKFKVKQYLKVRFKNNSQFGIKLHIWLCRAKRGTDTQPVQMLRNAMDDEDGPAVDVDLEEEVPNWPHEATTFKKFYKLSRHKFVNLIPGGEFVWSYRCKPYVYDVDFEAENPLNYRRHRSAFCFWKQEGVIGHDATVTSNIGITRTILDTVYEKHYSAQRYSNILAPTITVANQLEAMTEAVTFDTSDPGKETETNIQ
jgi:hypothetical protein